jgi:hypothetical protein
MLEIVFVSAFKHIYSCIKTADFLAVFPQKMPHRYQDALI